MSNGRIQIRRYPNRRYYAHHASKYVSLQDIEELIQAGKKVEIRDSQTDEDLTRSVLTQMIVKQRPEKMSLFPTDMLHFILRSNDAMSDFLRDYFRQSLTYLDYLQRHSAAATSLAPPIHWLKTWLDGIKPDTAKRDESSTPDRETQLAQRVEELEERIRQLEAKEE